MYTGIILAMTALVMTVLLVSTTYIGTGSAARTPTQMVYEDVKTHIEQTTTSSYAETGKNSAAPVTDGDRTTNLRFVTAIQNSSIWIEIKKRSLTVRTEPRLDQVLEFTDNRSPESLSDEELAKLKRACHDGLKCVAVDQILVLKRVKQPLNDDMVLIRTVVYKITKVLTDYTTEYDEDTYRYEVIEESDGPSKVYESMTTIIEDNRKLCQIDDIYPGDQVNTVNVDLSVGNNSKGAHLYGGASAGGVTSSDGVSNDADNSSKTPNDDVTPYDGGSSTSPANDNTVTPNDGVTPTKTSDNDITYTVTGAADDVPAVNKGTVAIRSKPETNENLKTNGVGIGGGKNNIHGDVDADVASSGSFNEHDVQKGKVSNSVLNNGEIDSLNVNKGTINRGYINESTADRGIISVGTVNNGPTNLGSVQNNTNNGNVAQVDNYDIQQFVNTLDKMYSSVLDNLAK